MSYKVEKVNPYNADQRKNDQVTRMFNDIAPMYDRLNGALSLGIDDIIRFEYQDCAEMTFADNSFDAATVSFGVRNFEDIDKSFQEVRRVVKPGGVFLFIELTTPDKSPMKELYSTYTKYVMPFLSGLFDTEQRAYQYLPESIAAFPQGREMMLILKKNGFRNIRLRRYTLGITTLYIAEK